MVRLGILIIMVFCFQGIGQSQPGLGSFEIRIFNEQRKPIFFTPTDSVDIIEAHYESEEIMRSVTDTDTSRRTYGYNGFEGGIVNEFVIHYNNEIMTISLMENCPLTVNGGLLVIDDVLFKEGNFSLNCRVPHEKVQKYDTLPRTNVIYSPNYGFYVDFNPDFLDFPETLQTDREKEDYLNKNLKIVFIDSTKTVENSDHLIFQCKERIFYETKRTMSVDSTKLNVEGSSLLNKLIFTYDTSVYTRMYVNLPHVNHHDESSCFDEKYLIKDLSLISQSKGTIYWYTGKLIFIYNGIKKEFFLKNIPDGYTLYLNDIKLDKPNESIELPPFLGKTEIRDIDLNTYRR